MNRLKIGRVISDEYILKCDKMPEPEVYEDKPKQKPSAKSYGESLLKLKHRRSDFNNTQA